MENKFLKFVDFKNIESWSIYAILGSKFDYSNHFELAKIREFLKRNKTQVSIEDNIDYKRPTIKINGQGIFLRDIKVGKEIGTKNQFRIKEGQFLLSKIDARNGAFGVVPNELDNGIITGNFWTFDVDYDKINPHFLTLVTKTKQFQNLSQSASVGTTNRNYLQEEEFLNFQIPLPTISEQEAIVAAYQAKILAAQELEQQAQNLENQIENYLFEELGISFFEDEKKKGLRFIEFKDLERWDGKKNDDISSDYPIFSIGKFIKSISTGTTPPTSRKEYFEGDVNFYTPAELGNEMYLYNSERKITELAFTDRKARKFEKGTLLFVGIGSTVGKVGIIANDYASSNQQITGFMVDEKHLMNEYVYYYFNHFKQVTVKEQTKATLPIVNQEKIMNIPIPVPPLSKQNEIVATIATMKQTQKEQTQTAIRLREEALQEFESVIFE